MTSIDNLKAAFSGESQANRKYLAFAEKALAEGFPQTAKLFKAAAAAETVHALAHLRAMGGVKSTLENLQEASAGEHHEFSSMYPPMIETAVAEGNRKAEITFKNANAVEEIHHTLYGDAISAVKTGKDLPEAKIYVCEVCGNTVLHEAPEKCGICGVPRSRFTEVV
jgi:rubrerythrin